MSEPSVFSQFYSRSSAGHISLAASRVPYFGYTALRDASGLGFASSIYYNIRSRAARSQGKIPSAHYFYNRAKGFSPTDAINKTASQFFGKDIPTGFSYGGIIASSIGVAYTLSEAFGNEYGPGYGAAASIAGSTAAAIGGRMGWGIGAAAGGIAGRYLPLMGAGLIRGAAAAAPIAGYGIGAAGIGLKYLPRGLFGAGVTSTINTAGKGLSLLSRLFTPGVAGAVSSTAGVAGAASSWALSPIGLTVGPVIGAIAGTVLGSMATDFLFNELPQIGYQQSRRGFGNIDGPYQDTQRNATMRQASLQAINRSHMNARSALGNEAAIIHSM